MTVCVKKNEICLPFQNYNTRSVKWWIKKQECWQSEQFSNWFLKLSPSKCKWYRVNCQCNWHFMIDFEEREKNSLSLSRWDLFHFHKLPFWGLRGIQWHGIHIPYTILIVFKKWWYSVSDPIHRLRQVIVKSCIEILNKMKVKVGRKGMSIITEIMLEAQW